MSRVSFFCASLCFLSSRFCATSAVERIITAAADSASPRRVTTIRTHLQEERPMFERSMIGTGSYQVKPFYRRYFGADPLENPHCGDTGSVHMIGTHGRARRRRHCDRARGGSRRASLPADQRARQTGGVL